MSNAIASDMKDAITAHGDDGKKRRRSGSENRQRTGAMAVRATGAEYAEIKANAAEGGFEDMGAYVRSRAIAPAERAANGDHGPEARAYIIPYRVTEEERRVIETAAAEAQLKPGSYVRARALRKPVTLNRRAPRADMEALAQTLGLLGKYGSNVNQLAREANAQGRLPPDAVWFEIMAQVKEMRAVLMQALGKRDP